MNYAPVSWSYSGSRRDKGEHVKGESPAGRKMMADACFKREGAGDKNSTMVTISAYYCDAPVQ